VILKGIDGPINDTQKQDLSAIYNSGQHLLTLINNILDLSKIEAGKMDLQISEVNIADLVNSVMSTAVGLVKDKPIRLHQEVLPTIPLVRADQTRVRQILLNFVSNAAKFTEEGSITVSAQQVSSPTGKGEVMILITDTGTGIAHEDQDKLFQPFSQVDDSPTRKTGGTGLGLSICRSMVEMHGGRIGLLRSEVGKGSTFFFTLPIAQAEPVPEEIPQESNIILSIDDDEQVISLYQRYLKPQGYQVVPLTDPKQALQRVKEVKPYAITLDIMMPEVDGWQVLQLLKNDPETRNIPIVICSILEDEEKGFSLGAADYLVKPFLQEELTNTVNHLNKDGQIHNILVIDDDPGDLRLVQKMLESNGKFQITLANGGRIGWEELIKNRPDAVILDLFMPDLDGFTLLGNMRSNQKFADLPVIVLTGADLTAEQHTQMAQLGQQMLTKGLLRERELLNTLDNALKKIRE
jgi:CheY-like chemotaxis protein/anti-sigma regulatory factor (Ser/Thr protein kinase)